MSGKVVGELNIPNGDTSYDTFTQSLRRSLFFVEMLKSRSDFYIVQNKNIILKVKGSQVKICYLSVV